MYAPAPRLRTKLMYSAPESFGMVDQPIGQMERRNLAAVANLLTHVAAQEDPSSLKDRFVRVPLQEYIKSEGPVFRDWIMDGGFPFCFFYFDSFSPFLPLAFVRNVVTRYRWFGDLTDVQWPMLNLSKATSRHMRCWSLRWRLNPSPSPGMRYTECSVS